MIHIMNVTAMSKEIIGNYKILAGMAHIKPKNNVEVPYWQLRMGRWCISQNTDIWCSTKAYQRKLTQQLKSKEQHPYKSDWCAMTLEQLNRAEKRTNYIKADIGTDKFELKIKPFWMSKKRAMSIINEILSKFIANYGNETVEKGKVPVRIYTSEYIDYLSGKNPNFVRVDYE